MQNILVPLRFQNFSEIQDGLIKIGGRANWIEIWLDKLWKVESWCSVFEKIRAKNPELHFLGVCKSPAEHGNFRGSEKERIAVLKDFLLAGGDAIDLDIIRTDEKYIRQFPHEKLFLSVHDFSGMPDDLSKIFRKMHAFHPFVYKFAVTTNTSAELEKFLAFIQKFPPEFNDIFTTMGKKGAFERRKISKMKKSWGEFFALNTNLRTALDQPILQGKG